MTLLPLNPLLFFIREMSSYVPPGEVENIVFLHYLNQAKRPPVVVETPSGSAALSQAMFGSVSLALPLKTV